MATNGSCLKCSKQKFLRFLISALIGVASPLPGLEKGIPKMEVRALKLMLNYWLKVHFFPLETINSNQWLPLELEQHHRTKANDLWLLS